MDKRFMDVKGMAEYLCVSESTIRSWVKHGKIPYMKIGKCVRFDLNDLYKWLKHKRIRETSSFHLEGS